MAKKKKPQRLKRRVRPQAGTKKQPAGQYREGDAVRVKPGTACPDAPDLDIGGWQGRVTDLTWANDTSDPTIGFAWDSISLRAMPPWFIEEAERQGLDWIFARHNGVTALTDCQGAANMLYFAQIKESLAHTEGSCRARWDKHSAEISLNYRTNTLPGQTGGVFNCHMIAPAVKEIQSVRGYYCRNY
jgi:hypothetical protein